MVIYYREEMVENGASVNSIEEKVEKKTPSKSWTINVSNPN